jgi:hypothetical protein
MESLGWLKTQQFLLDGWVGLLYHPEFFISRVFQYATKTSEIIARKLLVKLKY